MNSWPDSGMTPFRSEKNSNWEGAYRVPSMVHWPGKIKPGSVFNDIVSHLDWAPTLLAAAGVPDVLEVCVHGATCYRYLENMIRTVYHATHSENIQSSTRPLRAG